MSSNTYNDDVESKASAHAHEFSPDTETRSTTLKLDPNGYELRPQPSDDPLDPLNWPSWAKLVVLLQVSFLGFLGPFSQGTINSAFGPLSKAMGVSVTVASYSTTIAIVVAGVAPLVYSPISNIYGRRPVYIISTAVGIAANAGCAVCKSWAPLLVARACVGIGTSVGMGIGASVVSDMYFMHQRGLYMGIYVVFVTNGAHVAAIVGGFTAKYAGWRWCYWVPTIILGATWIVNIFCLPETLYHRDPITGASQEPKRSLIQLFNFKGVSVKRQPKLWDITHCFIMLKYPSVLLAGFYYSIAFGAGTVLFAVTGAAAFGGIYGFDTSQVGLAIGLSTTIGSLLGELVSGSVSDKFLYFANKRKGGNADPEARLHATWPGAFILPAGVIIEGVCLQYKTHWSGPVIGIGIGAFGLQIVSTSIFAYLTDCYKPQSAEISTLLNFGRLTFSFTLGFYMTPFAHETTYGIAWAVIAIITFALYAGVVLLMWKGAEWRKKLGRPSFDRDL
ncbi:major facilitator superfamily domain-containing protein [Xylogone sp. PMI_703]|nr:major facilitator superfamily domain-containing protein [Xylogone sp. PMI_703]